MKKLYLLLSLALSLNCYAQNKSVIDSLRAKLTRATDTAKVNTLIAIGDYYSNENNYDQSIANYFEASKLAEDIHYREGQFQSLYSLATFFESLFKHTPALQYGMQALKIAERQANSKNLYDITTLLANIYFNQGNYAKSMEYQQKIMTIAEKLGDSEKIADAQMGLGDLYREQKNFAKALEVYQEALKTKEKSGSKSDLMACLNNIATIYDAEGKRETSLRYYLEVYQISTTEKKPRGFPAFQLSQTYQILRNYDKALFYARKALENDTKNGDKAEMPAMYKKLADIYEAKRDYKQALDYTTKYYLLNDSLSSSDVQNKMQLLETGYKSEKQAKDIDFLHKQASIQANFRLVLIGASVLLLITVFLIANKYRIERRSERALSAKNAELMNTVNELKSTQAQLIQKEKMASLGELTAGIAHEIQNPLNFVNNFSEVSVELVDEMDEDLDKGDIEDAKEIGIDLKQNLEKIHHHGKRADAIVKGMLEHSRSTSGQKGPTDINQLADEYLRLSYHGLRAKDKSFNAELVTHFDAALPKVNAVVQDIGRVLLNLFNNAFYAVNQKQKALGADYKPEVSVSTSTSNGQFVLRVKDNGTGIPDAIKDKIMQPFFTTKPTGEGTGLGLSLTYDMVVKGHGGSISVQSTEGKGSEFIINLPY